MKPHNQKIDRTVFKKTILERETLKAFKRTYKWQPTTNQVAERLFELAFSNK